uniref:Sema domain, transmembrane domain (TM), and cytoplasmic domain, (semaphorin) 6D n=1 Tax=Gasterosteus aculeatus TaxID=69293 RepID=G3P618_GASAC
RDHVFAVNLTTASEDFVPQLKLTWRSTDVSKCTVRGKNSDECYNYVKVLVPRNDETLFACGTNAFNPTCRNYKMRSLERVGEDVVGQARCPFESGQSNVGLFAGESTRTHRVPHQHLNTTSIIKCFSIVTMQIRTERYSIKYLMYLSVVEYKGVEYKVTNVPLIVVKINVSLESSRVARVCKNDNGGSAVLERYWTSFLKARLNCSVSGDSFFYFDVLQSLTNVLQINQKPAVVGVFITQTNSIPGSAVCAFYMDDIEEVFSGKFKEQRTSDSSWTPVPDEQVPRPRPGSCAGDGPAVDFTSSVLFPDEMLMFIKSYPLMDEAVPSINHRPCFTRTSSRSKLTQIVVDVSAGPHKDRTVMFLGSDDGRVLKVLASTHPNDSSGSKLLEDIHVYNPSRVREDRRVLDLGAGQGPTQALFMAFSSCVNQGLAQSRCTQAPGACWEPCLASRDPYCIWLRTGTCANMAPGFKAGFEQDVDGPNIPSAPVSCHTELSATAWKQEPAADLSFGVRRLPEAEQRSVSEVHYTLLIACVLVAFSLGALLSGFLASHYCGRGGARREGGHGKDPEVSLPHALTLPHALSLRSLAKLNGLLDGQPKSQADGELSGLPTPGCTPELPVPKSMRAAGNHQNQNHNTTNNSLLLITTPASTDTPAPTTPAEAITIATTTTTTAGSTTSGLSLLRTAAPPPPHCPLKTPLQQQVIPEGPGGGEASNRHLSQRHPLIKMGSFNQRGGQHAHFLARMNTNSSSNGPPPSACLTRQHSYSGVGPHGGRRALVRRTASLKPNVPPKPLFLPNTSTPPVAEAGKCDYY